MSEDATGSDTGRCDRCGSEGETTTFYRDGHVWGQFCTECHDEIAEFATSDPNEQTPQEKWEDHNASFRYDPPQKPAHAWSTEDYQELYDRVISRRTEWFCQECSGRGPFGSLQKVRRHVESNHATDLVERYVPDESDLQTATDGGTSGDVEKREEENHGLDDFSGGESA